MTSSSKNQKLINAMILNLNSSQVSFILDETMSFVMDVRVKKAASI